MQDHQVKNFSVLLTRRTNSHKSLLCQINSEIIHSKQSWKPKNARQMNIWTRKLGREKKGNIKLPTPFCTRYRNQWTMIKNGSRFSRVSIRISGASNDDLSCPYHAFRRTKEKERKRLANNTDKKKNVEKHTKCFSREAVV